MRSVLSRQTCRVSLRTYFGPATLQQNTPQRHRKASSGAIGLCTGLVADNPSQSRSPIFPAGILVVLTAMPKD